MLAQVSFHIILAFLFFLKNTTAKTDIDKTRPKVLVFGGNSFLGSETVELLLASGYHVTIVNRGNRYWDSEERIFARVQSITCDREKGLNRCQGLADVMREEDVHFDAVIDFSASRENEVRDAAQILKNKVGLYILKSTHSVYDVCDIQHIHNEACKELEAVRPKNETDRKMYQRLNTYGHQKLVAEEELVLQREHGGMPYVILRVPDVIGPKDVTYRFWMHQLWLKVQPKIHHSPVTLPDFLEDFAASMVYSPDVAQLIVKLVKREIQGDDNTFNVAWPKSVTVKQLLQDISSALDQKDTQILIVPQSDARYQYFWYPSGRSGPMDVSKAVEMLKWSPTPWKKAIKDTVTFYETAMKNEKFQIQVNEVIQVLEQRLNEEDSKLELYEALEILYNISLQHFKVSHDEL